MCEYVSWNRLGTTEK